MRPAPTPAVAVPATADDDALPFERRPEAAVLCAPPAPVPAGWVAQQLRRHWALEGDWQPLAGERDLNHRLQLPDGSRWLVKLSHPVEPPEVTDYQTQALPHLAHHAPALPVQRLRPACDGRPAVRLEAPDGRPRVLRVISWLEGLPMPQAQAQLAAAGQGAALARQRAAVATLLARLDRALAGLQHPAAQRALPWDISRAHQVRSLFDAGPARPAPAGLTPARRALALQALDLFSQQARGPLQQLPRQPIHNDFNVHNLLVDPADPQRLAGVLDFGDMLAAPRVNDLAVAAAYQLQPDGDALATVAGFAAAYHAESPLKPQELDLLWPLVLARLTMVVAISGWRAQREPDKADYLLRNNPVSWARLEACAATTPARAREALRARCGV